MAKILLIDDNDEIQAVFCQFLTGMGHEIIQAGNGKQGLKMIEESRPDLVITDIMMPEMDGLEFRKALLDDHKEIPFVLISGFITKELALRNISDFLLSILSFRKQILWMLVEKDHVKVTQSIVAETVFFVLIIKSLKNRTHV